MMLQELASLYYNQGIILAGDNRMTTAIDRLENAVVLDPTNWKAWNVLGLCLYQLGEFDKAKKAWEKSIDNHREDNPALEYLDKLKSPEFNSICQCYNRALEAAKQEDYRGAVKIMLGNKKGIPSFVFYLNLLGLCLYGSGRRARARMMWKKALELDKDHPDAQNYIVQSLRAYPSILIELWRKFKNLFLFRQRRV
jgi:Flp pilus assembly protein TadD